MIKFIFKNMLDFLNKTLVDKFHYTTANNSRYCIKNVVINGRSYNKYGINCAVNAMALEYKVFDPSDKRYKYVVNVGIARQHPNDLHNQSVGIEVAMENALINPSITIKYDHKPQKELIYDVMVAYVNNLPITFQKTSQELKAEGIDLKKYNRNTKL